MTSSALTSPPESDELEIALFGRGMGECIVCHLGGGSWLMIDSFRNADGIPMAEAYLDSLGDGHRIVATIATHWDNDHTHGMAQVIARHEPREVWMPIVLNRREVFRFAVEHDRAMAGRAPSGLRDFVDVLIETKGRHVRRWGIVGRQVDTGTATEVALLSPTDELVDDALAALGVQMEPGFGEVTSPGSNATSVVVWVSRDNRCALLGADLEKGAHGWTAVVDRGSPGGSSASLIKVPHHGSSDADEPRIWSELAGSNAVNAATRYTRLKYPLPRPRDVQRLVSRAGHLYIAGAVPNRIDPSSDQYDLHLEAASIDGVRPAHGPVGVVRARSANGGDWRIEPFGAVELATAS